MTREQAKELFRNDKDAYGKPRHIMKNIDQIYDEFEDLTQVKDVFSKLSEHERLEIMNDYCKYCGAHNPKFSWCQCMNDE
jgi:hypothetical protein